MKRNIYSDIEVFSRTQIEEIQLSRLKEQLNRCYHLSQFYKKKLTDAGFEPGSLTRLDQLQHIPFTYKNELRESQSIELPWGQLVLPDPENWVEIHPTTGTTGAPIYTIWSQNDIKNITEYVTRMLYGIGLRRGDVIHNAFSYGLRVGAITVQRVAERLGCFILPVGQESITTQIQLMVNLRPSFLVSTPSFAFYLAEKLSLRGMEPPDLSFRVGCFGGEPGVQVPSARIKIERELGLKAFDVYGLVEIGPLLAAECEQRNGLHWAEDYHLVEVINPETMKPCEPDEVGVLVITDLAREAMPLIRYWTNDMASINYKKCDCGRTHARSPGGILGRVDDLVIFKGVKFYPAQVEDVIRRYDELASGFVVVLCRHEHNAIDKCIVKVECLYTGEGLDLLRDAVKKALRDELKVDIDVELIRFGTLERSLIKSKRLIDQR